MHRLRFRFGVLLLSLGTLSPRVVAEPAVLSSNGIEISGTPRFAESVRRALSLLEEHASDSLAIVLRHVRRIEEGPRSGMDVYASVPCLSLGELTVAASPTWLAGAIVHDAFHAVQFFEHPRFVEGGAGSVPVEAWTGVAAEREANRVQLDVLRRLGAPAHELAYLEAQDGSHFDIDGDGRYTAADYAMRNW